MGDYAHSFYDSDDPRANLKRVEAEYQGELARDIEYSKHKDLWIPRLKSVIRTAIQLIETNDTSAALQLLLRTDKESEFKW